MSFNKGAKTPSSGEGVDVQDGKAFSLNGKAFRNLTTGGKYPISSLNLRHYKVKNLILIVTVMLEERMEAL